MQYYVMAQAKRQGDGTAQRPFQTIGEAAAIAQAGDEVLVHPGVYREWVNPKYGGTDEAHRIIYRALEPRKVVITGAEVVKGWKKVQGNVWQVSLPNSLFGAYNPYTTIIQGDWYNPKLPLHTGEVYINGQSMYEVFNQEAVLSPKPYRASWNPEASLYVWRTEQAENQTVLYANFQGQDPNVACVEINVRRNCFYPSATGCNYITLQGFVIKQAATTWAPPTAYQEGMVGPHWAKGWVIEDCEIADSKCAGISLGKYLQPNNENKWTTKYVKDGTQTERDAICQAQREGWTKETIGSHIIRRCEIHDCGQTGIVGHLGGVFSLIEENHIHHINNKQDLSGAEIGGIKMHAAIDVIIRRNHIHHCTRGLWLDWQAQGTRVTQNFFHDNEPPAGTELSNVLALGEDIFIEVSHGPTLVDNNILLSHCAGRLSTQGLAFVHNLIAGSFTWVGEGTDNGGIAYPTSRYTPYHVPHRTEIAGFMTILHGDTRFYNNIFVQAKPRADLKHYAQENGFDRLTRYNFICGTKPYDGYPKAEAYFAQFKQETVYDWEHADRDMYYGHLPIYTGGNVYYNGAKPCDNEEHFAIDETHTITWQIEEREGKYYLKTNLYDALPTVQTAPVNTEVLGEAFEPEQRFEAPDGLPLTFDRDYLGQRRSLHPLPGPFANAEEHTEPLA